MKTSYENDLTRLEERERERERERGWVRRRVRVNPYSDTWQLLLRELPLAPLYSPTQTIVSTHKPTINNVKCPPRRASSCYRNMTTLAGHLYPLDIRIQGWKGGQWGRYSNGGDGGGGGDGGCRFPHSLQRCPLRLIKYLWLFSDLHLLWRYFSLNRWSMGPIKPSFMDIDVTESYKCRKNTKNMS